MQIRKTDLIDLEPILKIYQEVYSEPPYNEKWEKENLREKLYRMIFDMDSYIAEMDGKIAGFIFAEKFYGNDGLEGYIEDFCVKQEFRKRGVGESLMNEVEKKFKEMNIKRINLDVNTNSDAFKFYINQNFKETGYIRLSKELK